MRKLEGKRVALAGSRKTEELSKLVENLGGVPLVRTSQGTVFLDDSNIEGDIHALLNGSFQWMILTTGVGTEILYQTAVKLGKGDDFLAMLSQLNIAARGYKTVNMLKKLGLTPLVRDDDGSTAGLIRTLAPYDLHNKKIALQLHGDPAPNLIQYLESQGAEYKEILPYIHIPPAEETMASFLEELLSGQIDAVFFTSTPQGRYLFQFAREKGKEQELIQKFQTSVLALAVGKVTAAALKEDGIERVIYPENERMGSAIMTLAQYYQPEKN